MDKDTMTLDQYRKMTARYPRTVMRRVIAEVLGRVKPHTSREYRKFYREVAAGLATEYPAITLTNPDELDDGGLHVSRLRAPLAIQPRCKVNRAYSR